MKLVNLLIMLFLISGCVEEGSLGAAADNSFANEESKIVQKYSKFSVSVPKVVREEISNITIDDFIVTSDDAVITNLVVNTSNLNAFTQAPIITRSGALSFYLADGFYGDVEISVSLANNSNFEPILRTLTILPKLSIFNLGLIPVISVIEDQGFVTISNFTGKDIDNNYGLIEVTTIELEHFSELPSILENGDLTFKVKDDYFGKLKIRSRLASSVHQEVETIINVAEVNDLPSFHVIDLSTTSNVSGGVSTSEFVTSIELGAANESPQKISSFVVTASNSELFSQQPHISIDGTLSYTPAVGQIGTSLVSIMAVDDGGTENGGTNVSIIQTFNIHINPSIHNTGAISVLEVDEDSGPFNSLDYLNMPVNADTTIVKASEIGLSVSNDYVGAFIKLPTIGDDGKITFTIIDDFNGELIFNAFFKTYPEITLQTIIKVNPVNDKPNFSSVDELKVSNASGINNFENFISNESVGPANEGYQQITNYDVVIGEPGLFDVQPYISLDGMLTFTPKVGEIGESTIDVTAHDNGGDDHDGEYSSLIRTSTIFIEASLHNLQVPSVGSIPEDNGLTVIDSFANFNIDLSNKDIIIEVDKPELFSSLPKLSELGALEFEIIPDYNGDVLISFKLQAEPNIVSISTITVRPVNDAPNFIIEQKSALSNAAGSISVPDYASALSTGPDNENSQIFRKFMVVTDNPNLFIVQPSISSDGTLTYTPKIGEIGSTIIHVTAFDNGGTADNGIEISSPQSSEISVFASIYNLMLSSELVINEDSGMAIIENFSKFPTLITSNDVTINPITNSFFKFTPELSENGSLRFEMSEDYYGLQELEFYLTREPAVIVKTLVEILPVNDIPSFSLVESHKSLKNSNTVTVSGFTYGVGKGAENESNQVVAEYKVSVVDETLFSSLPKISNLGVLTYTPAHGKVGSSIISVTMKDSGGVARSGVDTSISHSSSITINAPQLSDLSVAQTLEHIEDQGEFVQIKFVSWADSIDYSDIQISYNTSMNLISPPVISELGDLSFEAGSNEYGDLDIVLSLIYDGTKTISRTVIVQPVNDKPSFEIQSMHRSAQDIGIVSEGLWATNERIGPSNENDQVFTQYLLSNSNPGLFTIQPVINASGTLFYEAKAGSYGQATVSAVLFDSGGTLHEGVDVSESMTFNITVDPSFPLFTVSASLNPKEILFDWEYTRSPGYYLLHSRDSVDEDFEPLDTNYDGIINFSDHVNAASISTTTSIPVYSKLYLDNAEFSLFAFTATGEFMSKSDPVNLSNIDNNSLIGVIQNFSSHNNEKFGGVSALSSNNVWLAIGAEDEKSIQGSYGNPNIYSGTSKHGAVFVLKKNSSNEYVSHSYLKSKYPETAINFGGSADISSDGSTLVIGNKGNSNCGTGVNPIIDNSESCNFSGAVEIFELIGNTFVHVAFIKDAFSNNYAYFGSKVSISSDGQFIAVGHINDPGAGLGINPTIAQAATSSGAVYLYKKDVNGDWQLRNYIKPTDTGRYLSFGSDVVFDNQNNLFISQGRTTETIYTAALSKYSLTGTTLLESYIELDFDSSAQLPTALDVSGDGLTFVVGSLQRSSLYGGVLVGTYDDTSDAWEQSYIETTQKNALFGIDARITNNGERIFVGAYSAGTIGEGTDAQYVYGSPTGMVSFFDINTNGNYDLKGSFAAKHPEENSYFSNFLEIDLNGTTIIVSNSGEDSDGNGVNPENSDTTIDSGSINLY